MIHEYLIRDLADAHEDARGIKDELDYAAGEDRSHLMRQLMDVGSLIDSLEAKLSEGWSDTEATVPTSLLRRAKPHTTPLTDRIRAQKEGYR